MLRELAPLLSTRVARGGSLVLCGLLADPGAVAFDPVWFPELEVVDRRSLDGWDAVVLAVR